jgi:hypothetical protein
MENIRQDVIEGYKTIEYIEKNIYIVENIIDDELCEEIKNIIDVVPLDKINYTNGNNVKCYITEISKLLEKSDELYYPFSTNETEYKSILKNINNNTIYINELNGIDKKKIKNVFNKMNIVTENIQKIFKTLNDKLSINYNSGFIMRKIYGETRLHCDGPESGMNRKTALKYIDEKGLDKLNSHFIRTLSVVYALNDDFLGGEFNFPYHNVQIKLKKGSVICFPPYWTHPHSVSNIDDNKYRYTISTWFCKKY